MKVLILAAGYATRLWPLTKNRPKPLLHIHDKPIIEHSLDKIKNIDAIDRVYVVTNTKFVQSFQAWAASYDLGKNITVIDDGMTSVDERLGSIGDILFSIESENISDDLLVIAGDNLFNFSLDAYIHFSVSKRPALTLGLFDVHDKESSKRYGIVSVDSDKKVTGFLEKPEDPPSTLAAMCLYFIPREKLVKIKEYKAQGVSLDKAGDFVSWLSKNETVYGYTFNGVWLDIGDKESLEHAKQNYKQ